VLEAQTGMAHMARFPGRVGPARSALERRLASSFRVRLHIYQKRGDLEGGGYPQNGAPPEPRSSNSRSDRSRISPPEEGIRGRLHRHLHRLHIRQP
jgi:hypothetical protein